jgi:hypothetical protein
MADMIGRLSEIERRRLYWLMPVVLLAAAGLGWGVGGLAAVTETEPSPVYADSDGLPAELIAGRRYTAEFRVAIPVDWPEDELHLMMTARNDAGHEAIYCGVAEPHPAGRTVRMACPVIAPSPGPLTLTFKIGGLLDSSSERQYPHVVRSGAPA